MARKSKQTICFEQLSKFSQCPKDIFTVFSPEDRLLDLIRECEAGNPDALNEVTERLFRECVTERVIPISNESLVYLCLLGIDAGVKDCSLRLGEYIDRTEEHSELAEKTVKAIEDIAPDIAERIRIKFVITKFVTGKLDFKDITETLGNNVESLAIRIFAYAIKKTNNVEELLSLRDDCRSNGCVSLLSHPSFSESFSFLENSDYLRSEKAIQVMLLALGMSHNQAWADFWLAMLYEDSRIFGGDRHTHYAKEALSVINRRAHDKRRDQHLLAFTKYAVDNVDDGEELFDELNRLKNTCKFEGQMPDVDDPQVLRQLMKEAVYTSSRKETEDATREKALGIIIQRGKNRFFIEGNLCGHSKRGKRHLWYVTLSFPKAHSKTPPSFTSFTIEEFHHAPERFGAMLAQDRTKSQIICRSEIIASEEPHPFILDLVLDISYISAAKCEKGEIITRGMQEDKEYYIFDCLLYLG